MSVTSIPGAFSAEQKEYLQGFFAGAAQRGALPYVGQTSAGLITADPSAGRRESRRAHADRARRRTLVWHPG